MLNFIEYGDRLVILRDGLFIGYVKFDTILPEGLANILSDDQYTEIMTYHDRGAYHLDMIYLREKCRGEGLFHMVLAAVEDFIRDNFHAPCITLVPIPIELPVCSPFKFEQMKTKLEDKYHLMGYQSLFRFDVDRILDRIDNTTALFMVKQLTP